MEYYKSKIRDLLNKSDEQMIIPKYQRDFVWKDDEAREFFDDLTTSERRKPLFIGTFIFNQNENGEKIEIVDGQQRITIILIFLIVCRVLAKEKGLSEGFISSLHRYITLQSINPSDESPCRLETDGRIGQSLKVMSTLNWSGEYEKSMGSKYGWNRIQKAYDFFYEKLKESYNKDMEELVTKLLNIDYINITVKNEVEAISTFERVNARGQHLAVYDLIKAYLFAKKLKGEGLENIEKDWEEIRKNVDERADTKLKKMLHFFYFSQKGYAPHAELYRNLKSIAEPDSEYFIKELKLFSKFYSLLSSKDFSSEYVKNYFFDEMKLKDTKMNDEDRINRVVKSLFSIKLFKVDAIYPLIYSSLLSLSRICETLDTDGKKEIDEWISLLEFFEKFYFTISRIAHQNPEYGGILQNLYDRYCKMFSGGDVNFIGIIQELKNGFREIKISEDVFIGRFKELSYKNRYDREVIYYIFDKLNNVVKETREIVKPGNASPLFAIEKYKDMANNIEHILPQSGGGDDDFADNLHSVGNLLVIHRKNNSTLGNKDPKEKIKLLKEWIESGAIQNKPYIEDFIEYYENECGGKWDEESIQKRTEHIAKEIYKITSYD